MAGVLERGRIDLHQVTRFPNGPVAGGGHLRWDLDQLYEEVLSGLRRVPEAESVAVDGWGVDYGLLDDNGNLLADPVAYWDDRTDGLIEYVHDLVSPEELYSITGTQSLPFNTIYQIAAEQQGPLWCRAAHAVLIPDLIAYWLTGELRSEVTNASTTALLDLNTSSWSEKLFGQLGIPHHLFPPIEVPSSTRGSTAGGLTVVTVGSHDTASAVAGVPATTERFAYVSCGTWSLVGLELEHPLLTEDARRAKFTNEVGVGGRIRFLRNVGGLWLVDECLRRWETTNRAALLEEAARLGPGGPVIDPDDPSFIAPVDMPTRISEAALGSGSRMEPPSIVRCILDSLARAFANTLTEACALARKEIDVIHIVGGGSQNRLLCQLTADATGIPVLAGPTEATAFGNVVVQAQSVGACSSSLDAVRASIAASVTLTRYDPA
jgi:rhamnulokinase